MSDRPFLGFSPATIEAMRREIRGEPAPRRTAPRVEEPVDAGPMLDGVLGLVRRGFAVVPLHGIERGACSCGSPDCKAPGKHPRTRRGVYDATRDLDVVRGWWARWPRANVAVATGHASGVVVIDIDGPAGLVDLDALGSRPATYTVRTGRGFHLYFRAPRYPVPNSAGKVGRKIDVRGEGGYVVGPESLHISGIRYTVIDAHEPAPMPSWLTARVRGER